MTMDYSEEGKVKFQMCNYLKGILDEAPDDMDGKAVTPAAMNESIYCQRQCHEA
jgi:hypothetical protein